MCAPSPALLLSQSCAQGPLCCLFSEPLWPGKEKEFLIVEIAVEGHAHLLRSPEQASLSGLRKGRSSEWLRGILFSSGQEFLTQGFFEHLSD